MSNLQRFDNGFMNEFVRPNNDESKLTAAQLIDLFNQDRGQAVPLIWDSCKAHSHQLGEIVGIALPNLLLEEPTEQNIGYPVGLLDGLVEHLEEGELLFLVDRNGAAPTDVKKASVKRINFHDIEANGLTVHDLLSRELEPDELLRFFTNPVRADNYDDHIIEILQLCGYLDFGAFAIAEVEFGSAQIFYRNILSFQELLFPNISETDESISIIAKRLVSRCLSKLSDWKIELFCRTLLRHFDNDYYRLLKWAEKLDVPEPTLRAVYTGLYMTARRMLGAEPIPNQYINERDQKLRTRDGFTTFLKDELAERYLSNLNRVWNTFAAYREVSFDVSGSDALARFGITSIRFIPVDTEKDGKRLICDIRFEEGTHYYLNSIKLSSRAEGDMLFNYKGEYFEDFFGSDRQLLTELDICMISLVLDFIKYNETRHQRAENVTAAVQPQKVRGGGKAVMAISASHMMTRLLGLAGFRDLDALRAEYVPASSTALSVQGIALDLVDMETGEVEQRWRVTEIDPERFIQLMNRVPLYALTYSVYDKLPTDATMPSNTAL